MLPIEVIQKRMVRAVIVTIALFIMIFLVDVFGLVSFVHGQPIPQQEQESRHIRAIEENTRALQDNTRALQALKRGY